VLHNLVSPLETKDVNEKFLTQKKTVTKLMEANSILSKKALPIRNKAILLLVIWVELCRSWTHVIESKRWKFSPPLI
jgi:hypothetical protein